MSKGRVGKAKRAHLHEHVARWWARRKRAFAHPTNPQFLNDTAMSFDTGVQHLVDRLRPPVVRENLDLGIAAKALRLDGRTDRPDVDPAVAHHAAVVEDVPGRHQPVADVERKQAVAAGARDLAHQLRVPPDVIDVEGYAEHSRAARIERVADVERL